MKTFINKLSMIFAAGCFGALVNSFTVWLFGTVGISDSLGVKIAPHFTAAWLYPRIVWGGLWGQLFMFPGLPKNLLTRSLIISIGPSLAALLFFLPIKAQKGILGFDLGTLTPLLVAFYNAVWAVATAIWIRYAIKSG